MTENKISPLNKFGIYCFKYSFIIGTFLFISFWITQFIPIAIVGIAFILIAAIVNAFTLLTLLLSMIGDRDNYLQALQTIGLMLINIPVVFVYLWILEFRF